MSNATKAPTAGPEARITELELELAQALNRLQLLEQRLDPEGDWERSGRGQARRLQAMTDADLEWVRAELRRAEHERRRLLEALTELASFVLKITDRLPPDNPDDDDGAHIVPIRLMRPVDVGAS